MKQFSYILSSVIFGAGVFGAIWYFEEALIGKAPTEKFVAAHHQQQAAEYKDPDIERLRQLTQSRLDDALVWLALAEGLMRKAADGIVPREKAALEAIDALRRVLQLDPENNKALLMMADFSFDLKVFSKAKTFYERYLEKNPEDSAARARYASTLTFLGKSDEARAILEQVIADQPEDFQAHAFLALTYAQLGDKEEVKRWGEKALTLAPHEEAKQRLQGFLTNFLSKESSVESPVESTPPTSLEEYFRAHSIVGPKVKSIEKKDETLAVTVEQFPMDAMPPFARTKFESGIRSFVESQAERSDITSVEFIDSETKTSLGVVKLN